MPTQPLSLQPDYGSTEDTVSRVVSKYLSKQASVAPSSSLDGMTRNRALTFVRKVIYQNDLDGFFRDAYWTPIQKIWKSLEVADIPFGLYKSEYTKNREGNPVSKVWSATISFTDGKGRAQELYLHVTASGAGSIAEPLETYDVTANVS